MGLSVRASFTHLGNFDRKQGLQNLSFLRKFKDVCDVRGIHEGAVVLVLSTFLEGDFRQFFMTKSGAAVRQSYCASSRSFAVTINYWPRVVQNFLKRYCSGEFLSKANGKFKRIIQEEGYTEA